MKIGKQKNTQAGAAVCAALFLLAAQAQGAAPQAGVCPLLPDAAKSALPPYGDGAHDQYLQRWRAGGMDARELLAVFAEWSRRPATGLSMVRLRADLIEVAAQAGAFGCAVERLHADDAAQLPDYALVPLIESARATRRTDLQAAAVQTWKLRSPQAWEPVMRETQWLIDGGRLADARAAIDVLALRPDATERAHRIQLMELEGALAEASGEPLLALPPYRDLLGLAPDHAYARQFNLRTLAALRGTGLALSDARGPPAASDAPGGIPARQLLGLQVDLLAQRLRDAQARRDNGSGLERFEALDRVIHDEDLLLDQLAQELDRAPPGDAQAWRALQNSLRADTLVALFERGHYAQAADRYERWRDDGAALPAWGLVAAGGAYARLRRSDLAIAPYEQALRASDPQAAREIAVSLIYAYLDTGRVDDARELLRQRDESIPPYLARAAPGLANHEFDDQQVLRANIALDTGQIEAGARLFDEMAANAPMNADMQLGQVRVLQLRERPQAARQLLQAIGSDHPASPAVQLAWADLLLDQGDFDAARTALETLERAYPQDYRVLGLRERYDRKTAGRVEINAGVDKDGGTLANRETRIDARVYSPVLLGNGLRLWGRQMRQNATLGGAHPVTFRTGAGVAYASEPFWAQAEIHRESLRGRAGIEVDSAWRASDSWRLNAHYDSFSLDTPWRALVQGVRMARADAGVTWIGSEARRIGLKAQHGRFTDGNRRNEWTGTWYERWISQPAWQLSTSAELSSGRHTRSDVSYFSPRSYHGEQIWGRFQWLVWKRDRKRLVQVLEAGGGSFWQTGHGAKSVTGVQLTHEWALNNDVSFFYGLSWKRRPYDGVREIQRAVFLGLSIPLR